jgi:glycosyltransferase involved in cell wall biosynthesis
LWVIPNGFNDELLALPLPEIDVPRVIFVGTLKYWPNAEAVIMFVRSILPRLLARHPALEFWIVGRSPVDEVLALDNGSSVRVFADVPDVIDYVRQAAVSVVPLRVGGGTRLKILESIGAGVPVVSTPVGIEGIDLQPETHFLQAVTPADFADQVSRLIDDPQLRKQQVIAARGEIARRYGWGAIRRDVTAKLLALRGAGAAPSTPP